MKSRQGRRREVKEITQHPLLLAAACAHTRAVFAMVLMRHVVLCVLHADASAAKRQAAEEAAKARKNKERLHAMFAKAAGRPHAVVCGTAFGSYSIEQASNPACRHSCSGSGMLMHRPVCMVPEGTFLQASCFGTSAGAFGSAAGC